MIAYIKGELADVGLDGVVVENNGIGYEVKTPASVMGGLPSRGAEVKIYTYTYVREDALQLYGFLNVDDLEMFRLLIGISGIGPKGALGILSAMSADDLRFAILSDDAKSISTAPGIGKKTAGKLILELKDKMDLADAFERKSGGSDGPTMDGVGGQAPSRVVGDAVEALVALGYSSTEALRAVKKVSVTDDMTVEEVLRQGLKNM